MLLDKGERIPRVHLFARKGLLDFCRQGADLFVVEMRNRAQDKQDIPAISEVKNIVDG